MSKVMMISSDCHAGALPAMYNEYMPKAFHEAAMTWWIAHAREMMSRAGTFFDQEAVEAYVEEGGEQGGGRMKAMSDPATQLTDAQILETLTDETSPFAPRRGEFDPATRIQELNGDGVAGEVIFPQMAPFGAGLMQYRYKVTPEQSLVGCQAYNRWLADFCNTNPARHAGVALINVDDIDVTVKEIRAAREMGLWGGVLLPSSTGDHPFYHHPRYEPIWAVCEELDMPIQSHSGWSPDYGDVPGATAMFISEVDMWAQRPFTALLWGGVFERHPKLKVAVTEGTASWVPEMLTLLDQRYSEHHGNAKLGDYRSHMSMKPSDYFARNVRIGTSLHRAEIERRYEIGIGTMMWGSDYPHPEGSWPETRTRLDESFKGVPPDEVAAMIGGNAAQFYGFDVEALAPLVAEIGPEASLFS